MCSRHTLIHFILEDLLCSSLHIPQSRAKGHMFIASLCLGQSNFNLFVLPYLMTFILRVLGRDSGLTLQYLIEKYIWAPFDLIHYFLAKMTFI